MFLFCPTMFFGANSNQIISPAFRLFLAKYLQNFSANHPASESLSLHHQHAPEMSFLLSLMSGGGDDDGDGDGDGVWQQ